MQKQIVLASLNFELAFKLTRAFDQEFTLNHVKPNSDLTKFQVIFCALGESVLISHENIIELNPSIPEFNLKVQVAKFLSDNLVTNTFIIGIDPGHSIGVCTILNQIIIESTVFYSIPKLTLWINSKLKEVEDVKIIIRIGNGGGKYQKDIIKSAKQNFPKYVEIQIIDEKNTSRKITSIITSHEQAAIRIAKRKGDII